MVPIPQVAISEIDDSVPIPITIPIPIPIPIPFSMAWNGSLFTLNYQDMTTWVT